MVALHQLLEPSLDLVAFGSLRQVQRLERSKLQRFQGAPGLARLTAAPIKKGVRIGEPRSGLAGLPLPMTRAVCPGVGADLPGRAVSGDTVLLVGLDFRIAHAREV